MTGNTSTDLTAKIVEMLSPLESEERLRIINASLTLLGEMIPRFPKGPAGGRDQSEEIDAVASRAQVWMKQNGISMEQLLQVFHIADGKVEIIVSSPGKDMKEQTLNAYVLTGLANFLASGEQTFDDKAARTFCKSSGCYDGNNHSTYLKGKGNEFTGTKDKGWTLTAPGLKRAAGLVQGLTK